MDRFSERGRHKVREEGLWKGSFERSAIRAATEASDLGDEGNAARIEASVREATRLETGNQSSCFLRSVILNETRRDETKRHETWKDGERERERKRGRLRIEWSEPLSRTNAFGWPLYRESRGYRSKQPRAKKATTGLEEKRGDEKRREKINNVRSSFSVVLTSQR